jgi:hypothetical protein
MTYDDVMATLGIAAPPAAWREAWDDAQATFPAEGLAYLTDDFLTELAATCDFPADILPPLRETLAQVRGSEPLQRLAWLWRELVVTRGVTDGARGWPDPAGFPLFSAVVVLMCIPPLLRAYAECDIPLAIARDTLRDLPIWMRNWRRRFGAWGFDRLGWMAWHLTGRLYRVGRMQYIYKSFTWPVRAYRHRATGEVVALFESGQRCRRDGYIDGTNGVADPDAWVTQLEEGAQTVCGTPVTRDGRALPEPVMLPLAEWHCVLKPGDPVLDMHIPADGKMDYHACGASVQASAAFFTRYFPENPTPVAFICYSWLLDYRYSDLLPAESNIVRWQREFHAFPVLSDDLDPFFRVFDGKPDDLTTAPRDTALRRAMLDTTLAGRPVKMAGGFILIDAMTWGV